LKKIPLFPNFFLEKFLPLLEASLTPKYLLWPDFFSCVLQRFPSSEVSEDSGPGLSDYSFSTPLFRGPFSVGGAFSQLALFTFKKANSFSYNPPPFILDDSSPLRPLCGTGQTGFTAQLNSRPF